MSIELSKPIVTNSCIQEYKPAVPLHSIVVLKTQLMVAQWNN